MAEVDLIHRSARHLRRFLVIFSPVALLTVLGSDGMGVATLPEDWRLSSMGFLGAIMIVALYRLAWGTSKHWRDISATTRVTRHCGVYRQRRHTHLIGDAPVTFISPEVRRAAAQSGWCVVEMVERFGLAIVLTVRPNDVP
jgi:hypothetical protein